MPDSANGLTEGDSTQKEWLLASQRGDTGGFGRLVEAHQKQVYSLAIRLTGRGDVADDVTQESFLAAWKNISHFRGEASFRTWILKIALNKVRSYWRWAKLRDCISLDNSPNNRDEEGATLGDLMPDPSRAADPPSALEDARFQDDFQTILMGFSARQREVLLLRAQGLEIQEIGSVLGVASGTVKAHLFEAKRKLQGKLGIFAACQKEATLA